MRVPLLILIYLPQHTVVRWSASGARVEGEYLRFMSRNWVIPPHVVYLVASEVGVRNSRPIREQVWKQLPFRETLARFALMLADVSSELETASTTDRRWVDRIRDTRLRFSVERALAQGHRLIAPQVVLAAMREFLLLRDEDDGLDDGENDLDLLICALLGVAEDLDDSGDLPQDWPDNPDVTRWGHLAEPLAAGLIANTHFNQQLPLPYLMARASERWGDTWNDNVDAATQQKIRASPRELFREATGSDIEAFIDIALSFVAQHLKDRHVVFPPHFIPWAHLTGTSHEEALQALSTDVPTLKQELHETSGEYWNFDAIKQKPLLRLKDGSYLVIHLGWLVERSMSEHFYHEVRQHLEIFDQQQGTERKDAFHRAIGTRFEADVSEILERTFHERRSKADRLTSRVWDETQLESAFASSGSKRQQPKIPDFVVQFDNTWLIIDATFREPIRRVTHGQSDVDRLSKEVAMLMTDRKAKQLNSMVELLTKDASPLIGSPLSGDPTFIPLIISGDYSLPWTLPVAATTQEFLERKNLLQQHNVLPLALMTYKDLLLVEHIGESQGPRVIETIKRWRTSELDSWEFHQFAHHEGTALRLPRAVKKRHNQAFKDLLRPLENRMKEMEKGN